RRRRRQRPDARREATASPVPIFSSRGTLGPAPGVLLAQAFGLLSGMPSLGRRPCGPRLGPDAVFGGPLRDLPIGLGLGRATPEGGDRCLGLRLRRVGFDGGGG